MLIGIIICQGYRLGLLKTFYQAVYLKMSKVLFSFFNGCIPKYVLFGVLHIFWFEILSENI